MNKILQIHPDDNVLVAIQDIAAGEELNFKDFIITAKDKIAAKHKVAIQELPSGSTVRMYGSNVGTTTADIPQGGLLTIENVQHSTEDYQIQPGLYKWQAPDISKFRNRTFLGYHRPDGKVGTANIWLFVPLVFCENRNIEVIKESLLYPLGYVQPHKDAFDISTLVGKYQNGGDTAGLGKITLAPLKDNKQKRLFENIDGIKFLTHQMGCGGTRQDAETLCRLIAGYLNNANVCGATILSLGCQNAQLSLLQKVLQEINPGFEKPLLFFEQQDSLSERAFIEEIIKTTFIELTKVNQEERQATPLSKLCLGLECGGSDGFSGISANPALGYCSDLLVGLGAQTILSEFPELHGAEQDLISRCATEELAKKFDHLMKAYARNAEAVGSSFAFNPSPGNIKDGLITDAMKSIGAARKGGTAPIVDVLDYTEQAQKQGLHLLCTPGNDVESTTGLAGSGATLIVFTTGLGTPTGNPVAPTIKMSSNSKLANRMSDIIDVDAGSIITGQHSIREKGEELLEYIIEVASGRKIPHAVRIGQDDFIPWKRGVSL